MDVRWTVSTHRKYFLEISRVVNLQAQLTLGCQDPQARVGCLGQWQLTLIWEKNRKNDGSSVWNGSTIAE